MSQINFSNSVDLKQENYDTSNTFPSNKAITAVSPGQVFGTLCYPLLMKFKQRVQLTFCTSGWEE